MTPTLALDVNGASKSNGANVQIWTRNWTAAQQWDVEETDDGHRILSSFLGKSLDVPSEEPESGDNVQMWTETDGRSQRWDLVDLGETLSVDGTARPLYNIKPHGSALCLDAEGASHSQGTNVMLYEANGGTNQKWALVPVPLVISGDVYEIVPVYAPKLRLDVAGASAVNGANVHAWASNGNNNQKYFVTDEGDGYSIRDINSGKYVDVNGQNFQDETNVQLWEQNGTRAQRWKLTSWGQAVLNGAACEVVSFGAGNEDSYMMDVAGASSREGANVIIFHNNAGDNQRFLLLPTVAVDSNMPVPSDIGLAQMGRDGKQTVPDGTWYVTWRCSDAWATPGPNSYRYRLRTRYMAPVGSSWGEWGEWSAWATAPVSMSGSRAWLTNAVDGNIDVDTAKSMQVQFQVASQGIGETRNISSEAADELLTVVYEPKIEITGAHLTADGLEVSYTSDYPYGAMSAHIDSLAFDGKDALAKKSTYRLNGQNGTFTIPFDDLRSLPSDGSTAAIGFYAGSDQLSRFPTLHNALPSVTVAQGTVDVRPTFSDGDSLTETAQVPVSGARVFLQTDSGMFELEGDTPFDVPYPFGSDYSVVTVYSNGSDWGVDVSARPAKPGRRAHALSWDGGNVVVWLREGDTLEERRTVSAQHEEVSLLNRRHTSVRYMGQTQVKGSFEGAVDVRGLNDPFGTTRYTLESAVEAGFCLYRSPFGRIAQVAVTEYSLEVNMAYADVSIDYIEVTR